MSNINMTEIAPGCFVNVDEIAAVYDTYDDRTVPPRRKSTTVVLRSGRELAAGRSAQETLLAIQRLVAGVRQ